MKEQYTAPEMKIIPFDTEDVITTSPAMQNGGRIPDYSGGQGDIHIQ